MRLWKREHFSHVWDVSALSIWNQLGVAWITLQSWMPKTWSSAKKISKRILSSVVSEHMKIATVVLLLHAFCIDILIKLELQAKWRDLFQCDSELPAISTRDAVQNPLNILKAAWAGKVSRYAAMVHEAGRSVQLSPVPISTLGGWHPDAYRALCSVATTIAARGMSTFSSAKSILFQRHAALLLTNNALCLMSGLLSGIWGGTYCST